MTDPTHPIRASKATPRRRLLAALGTLVLVRPAFALPPEDTRPIQFYANLSADEESAPTESPGKGRADFVLERATLKFSWTITYEGLTTPVTGVWIHGPQRPGTNAGKLIDLAQQGLKSPLQGSVILNEGQLEYLLAGRLYVNVFTTKYKDGGELRGQITRARLKPANS
jgi:hypothetical protein